MKTLLLLKRQHRADVQPRTTEEGGCSWQSAEGFPGSLALLCTQPAWPRESPGLGFPWHCQLDQKMP